MEDIILTMEYKKSTKGTHIYGEVDNNYHDEAVAPAIYFRRGALPVPPPKTISVTISVLED